MEEWINELPHRHTIKHDSVIKKSEVLVPGMTRRHLENVMPSERSQTQKVTYPVTSFLRNVCKFMEMENRLAAAPGLGEGQMGSGYFLGTEFGAHGNVLE